MTQELKPCPFCGGKGKIRIAFGMCTCTCSSCGVTTEARGKEKQAVDAWNNRPIESKLANKISSLEMDLAHFPANEYRLACEELSKENLRYFNSFVKVKEFLQDSRLEDYEWYFNLDNKDIEYIFDIVDKTLRGER